MSKSLLSELIVRISAKPDSTLNSTLRAAKKEVQDLTSEITDLVSKGSIAFGAFAVGAGLLVKSWLDAAGALEQYRAKLLTVLKNQADVNETIKRSVEYAAKTPFDVKSIVDATVQLEVYGQKSESILPRVGNLAAGMGKDIKDTALVIGKAMSGSLEGFESLRNEYGISTAKLAKYGAVMDSTGGISVRTAENLEKARNALQKVIDTEFGGAVERQSKTWQGAMSNLGDAIEKLKVALGEELIPAFTGIARSITGFVEAVGKAPAPIKALASWGMVAAGGLAAMAVPVLGLVAILPSLSAGISLVTQSLIFQNTVALLTTRITWGMVAASSAAVQGFLLQRITLAGLASGFTGGIGAIKGFGASILSTIGISGLLIGALAVGAIALALYTRHIEEKTKKLEESVQRDERNLRSLRDATRLYAGKSADELNKMGVTSKDLEEDIKNMTDSATRAFEEGNFKQGKMFTNGVRQAKEMKKSLEDLEKQYRSAQTALRDIAVEFDILKNSHAFKNTDEELSYLIPKIIEAQKETAKLKIITGHDIGLNFDFTNVEFAEYKLRSLQMKLAQFQKVIDDSDASDAAKKQAKMQADALKTQIDLFEKAIEAGRKSNEDRLKDSRDFIQRKKELNQLSISDEIKANERILQNQKLTADEEKEIRQRIAVLRRQLVEESKDKVEKALSEELEAVKQKTSGQIQAYDALIKKIQEYQKAGKIDAKDAKPLMKTAQKERSETVQKEEKKQKSDEEKEQKERYRQMVKVQEYYLKQVDDNENLSVAKRIGYLDSLERFWQESERRKVVTKQQAEEQIMKIAEKRWNFEKSIIEANKNAERELIQLRKDALSYNIEKLKEKMKAGVDVEGELFRKMDERTKIEMKAIDAKKKDMEKEGVALERVTEITAREQANVYRGQIGEIDPLISELQSKIKEETDTFLKWDMEKMLRSLQEKKSSLESDLDRATRTADTAQQEAERKGIAEVKTDKTGFDAPVGKFSDSVGIFSDTINNLKSIITGGKELTPIQAQAVAGGGNTEKNPQGNTQTGNRNTGKGDNTGKGGTPEFKGNININITVNGDKVSGNNKDVAVRSDKDKLNIGIPKNIWEAFQPEVKPTGR